MTSEQTPREQARDVIIKRIALTADNVPLPPSRVWRLAFVGRILNDLDEADLAIVRKPTGDQVTAAAKAIHDHACRADPGDYCDWYSEFEDVECDLANFTGIAAAALAAAGAADGSGLSREDAVGLAHATGFHHGFKAAGRNWASEDQIHAPEYDETKGQPDPAAAADGRTPDGRTKALVDHVRGLRAKYDDLADDERGTQSGGMARDFSDELCAALCEWEGRADRCDAAKARSSATSDGRTPDDQPETYCDRCGQRNVDCWYTDSALWNTAVPEDGVLCPRCFTEAYEKATGEKQIWRVAPADRSDETAALMQSEAAMRHELAAARAVVAALKDGGA